MTMLQSGSLPLSLALWSMIESFGIIIAMTLPESVNYKLNILPLRCDMLPVQHTKISIPLTAK